MKFVIVLLVLAAGGVFLAVKKKKKTPVKDTPSSPPKTAEPAGGKTPEMELAEIMDALIALNILIRTDDRLPEDLLKAIEDTIDDLKAVVPAMIQRYPAETLTYEMKKIGKHHLYKAVKEYLDMSDESRAQQRSVFEQTIAGLHDVASRSREIVEKNETAEFKTMANFLAGKFS